MLHIPCHLVVELGFKLYELRICGRKCWQSHIKDRLVYSFLTVTVAAYLVTLCNFVFQRHMEEGSRTGSKVFFL